MDNIGDKTYRCTGCHKDIHIPYNQVGGFWWLSGWEDMAGKKHFGGYCSKCFHTMSKIKRKANY